MGVQFDGDDLLTEMRKTRDVFDKHGTKLDSRVNTLEESINDIHKRLGR